MFLLKVLNDKDLVMAYYVLAENNSRHWIFLTVFNAVFYRQESAA
jgi:hypothetical protein